MLKGELQSFVATHFCCREATSYHDPSTTAIVVARRYVQLCIYQIFLMGVGVSFKQFYLIVHCPTLFDFKHYNKISRVQCLLRIFIPIKTHLEFKCGLKVGTKVQNTQKRVQKYLLLINL